MHKISTIILAWWSWTRLWPISRRYYPKQFLKLEELYGSSLFQKTLKRSLLLSKKEDILVVTNADYKYHCLTQASEIGIDLKESQILVEPKAKSTLNAIAYAMKWLKDTDLWLVLSSDAVIENEDIFVDVVKKSCEQAIKSIVTFWIEPYCPHTWYGYIEADKKWSKNYPYPVKNFKEKPNSETAKKFIKAWYYWNSWIFLFWKKIFWSELKRYTPLIAKQFDSKKTIEEIFENVPDLSIDYWILEQSKSVYVSPLPIYWNDLWSFDAIDDDLARLWYENKNVISVESKNNFVLSETWAKKVALVWVEDVIVVDTKDALLVSKKWQSSKLKEVINILKSEQSNLPDHWVTVYRPWWSYTIIDDGPWFKSKRITVLSWKKLSLQMHYHRSEHWVVVSWTATVTVWDKEYIVRKWESTFIRAWERHRLENKWKIPLHIIESQIWDYLEEDDIVRYDDDFWRKS